MLLYAYIFMTCVAIITIHVEMIIDDDDDDDSKQETRLHLLDLALVEVPVEVVLKLADVELTADDVDGVGDVE